MLYKDKESQEGYIHICDDAYRYQKKYIAARPKIFLHDVSVYMRVGGGLLDIKFCPYCGKKIEDEIETATDKFYEF